MSNDQKWPATERRFDREREAKINAGIDIASLQGVGEAMNYMRVWGIERETILRVLSSARFQRRRHMTMH